MLQIGRKRVQAPTLEERRKLLEIMSDDDLFPTEGVEHIRTFETSDFAEEEEENDSEMLTEEKDGDINASVNESQPPNDTVEAKDKEKAEKFWGRFVKNYRLPEGRTQHLTSDFFADKVLPDLADLLFHQNKSGPSKDYYASLNKTIRRMLSQIRKTLGAVSIVIYWHRHMTVRGDFFTAPDSACKQVAYEINEMNTSFLDTTEAAEQLAYASDRLDRLQRMMHGRGKKKQIITIQYMHSAAADILPRIIAVLSCYLHSVITSKRRLLTHVEPDTSVVIMVKE